MPTNDPADLTQIVSADLPFAGQKKHAFESKDRNWNLSLNHDFLALVCRSYERWEGFRDQFRVAGNALIDEHNPGFFTRIGLRYRDVIRRSRLELGDTPWSELVQPWIAGLLARDETARDVEDLRSTCVVRLAGNGGFVRLRCGLVAEEPQEEIAFLVDSDFYTEEHVEPAEVLDRLGAIDRQAGLLFRWCITDKLH